ncbi:hypothetical protein F0562_013037 [Nyssa sinensis]|uniref:X8 domain-containing protein n=1 Tax=Nyssa sinensis TaxID=561372 RepID=A0A5J4ZYS3_9ASTE|nr:hypothetical protein F0562_013037 [Nyssa sinensis]
MLKMVCIFHLLFLYLLGLTGATQESVELLHLYDPSPMVLQGLSHTGIPVAVSVSNEHLNEVSSSVIIAESWVRTHVLGHYPATNITTIVVGQDVLCNKNQEHIMGLVFPSIKNIYHSLTRWGLEREIKVSASFSSNCLHPYYAVYRDDLADKYIKPLLNFLENINSTYLVNPPPNLFTLSDETLTLVSSHTESLKNLGIFNLNKINVIISSLNERKPMSRKLSFMDSKFVDPFPARPTPLSPTHSSVGYSVPAYVAKPPLPPLVGTYSPPPFSLPSPPELPPFVGPASPPFGYNLPPCNPSDTGSPVPPKTGVNQGLWCVAKPSVPAETLQEAMDYACGEGGADCEAIRPQGSCFYPETIVAHASYAFNSYWQKNKRNGGTCNFGGTAMIINADPSFRRCQFSLRL